MLTFDERRELMLRTAEVGLDKPKHLDKKLEYSKFRNMLNRMLEDYGKPPIGDDIPDEDLVVHGMLYWCLHWVNRETVYPIPEMVKQGLETALARVNKQVGAVVEGSAEEDSCIRRFWPEGE